MIKISRNFSLFAIFANLILLAGCSSSTPPANTANANVGMTPAAVTSSPSAAVNTATPIVSPTINATNETSAPCAVVAAHHAALVRKDEAALRKTITQATIRQFEAEAKEEGEETIVNYLTAYSSPPSKPPLCGGAVQGEVAMLQTKNADNGVVTTTRAIRENNEWKLDLLSVNLK
jgi:hypothetical protein